MTAAQAEEAQGEEKNELLAHLKKGGSGRVVGLWAACVCVYAVAAARMPVWRV